MAVCPSHPGVDKEAEGSAAAPRSGGMSCDYVCPVGTEHIHRQL